jgi:hypothetical protein
LFRRPSQSKDYDPEQYLRDADTRFSFDSKSGIYQPKTYYEENKRREFKILSLSPYKWGTLILSAVTLIFLIRYTNYARLQWLDTHTMAEDATKSLNVVQEQFRLEQRPRIAITEYLLMDGIKEKPIPKPVIGKPVFITIKFKNLGHSPAYGVNIHYHLLFESQKSHLRVEPPDKLDMGGTAIEPGDFGAHVTVISVKDTYAQESILINPADLIGWDGSAINVFGRISYLDQFGKPYCLPYMSEMLSTGDWARVVGFPRFTSGVTSLFSVRELCSAGIQQ